jgi:glycerol-3-phosphate dehydrogenase
VRDVIDGDALDVRAAAVLNATGPWAAAFLAQLGVPSSTTAPRLSRAMNLVVDGVRVPQGCGGRARGRFLFMAPWRRVTLIGTSHDVHEGSADALRVSGDDVEAFLAEVREAFPNAPLTRDEVRLVHRGLLPMVSAEKQHVHLLRESVVIDHRRDGVDGLISMFGVRYTTARATAERAIDVLFEQRQTRRPPPCRTADTPLVGGAISSKEQFARAVDGRVVAPVPPAMLRRLATTYGTDYDTVVQLAGADPALAEPLGERCEVSGAEIVRAVRHEAAVRLSDALIRRTEAGAAGHPGHDAVSRASAIMAHELHWDDQRVRAETDAVEAFFRLPS